MKLLIFGATGSVGRELVKQALAQHHVVIAFVRNPLSLAEVTHPNLHLVKGDVLRLAEVEKAVYGQDAVLCAIGDGKKGVVRAPGTKNIIQSMTRAQVNRFICQTTLGMGESYGNLNFFWRHIMFGFLLKKAFLDHQLQEQYIQDSPLNYTIVRPGALVDGEATNKYQYAFDGTHKNLSLKITKADVAAFMLQQLSQVAYQHQAVSISN